MAKATAANSSYTVTKNNFGDISLIDVEHALTALMFPNFEGREVRDKNTGRIYNKEGDQNFCVAIPDELADDLIAEGWNVKVYEDNDGNVTKYIKVKINWHPTKVDYIPDMNTITNRKTGEKVSTKLDEETSKLLSISTLKDIDISIRRSAYRDDDGNWKPTARLAGAWATLHQSYLADKWNDLQSMSSSATAAETDDEVNEEDFLPFS